MILSGEDVQIKFNTLLKKILNSEYYAQTIPCASDDDLYKMIISFDNFPREKVFEIANSLESDTAQVLGLFAERMATLAVRKLNYDYVKRGLLALIMYSEKQDPRDVIVILSLLFDSAKKLGRNPKVLFNEFDLQFGGLNFLKSFLHRQPEDQKIEAMGYEESKDEFGFYYRRTW